MSRHPNSLAALRAIEPLRLQLYERIMRLVVDSPDGLTSDEIEAAMHGRHQNISARTTELRQLGVLHDSGRTRLTRGRRSASVLVADPAKVIPRPQQAALF